MTLYFAPQPITVHLTEMQLPAAIEAAHDALIRRVAWTVFRSARWEGVDWETVRTIVDSTASLYMTLMFVAKDQPAESFHEKFFGPDLAVVKPLHPVIILTVGVPDEPRMINLITVRMWALHFSHDIIIRSHRSQGPRSSSPGLCG